MDVGSDEPREPTDNEYFYEQEPPQAMQHGIEITEDPFSFIEWLKALPSSVLIVIFISFILGILFSKSLSTVVIKT